ALVTQPTGPRAVGRDDDLTLGALLVAGPAGDRPQLTVSHVEARDVADGAAAQLPAPDEVALPIAVADEAQTDLVGAADLAVELEAEQVRRRVAAALADPAARPGGHGLLIGEHRLAHADAGVV